MQTQHSTNQQVNKIIEFRQAIYQNAFRQEGEAQFELLDALTASGAILSFPELSLSPFFRREWGSAYAALERGQQAPDWLHHYLSQQIEPTAEGVVLLPLDVSAWGRPDAQTLPDRQHIHSSTQDVTGRDVVVGQPYSLLGWVAEPGQSWTLPLMVERVRSDQTEVEVGVAQVKAFCAVRGSALKQHLHIILADGSYGNHLFFGPLSQSGCAILARLRCDRVLYGQPGPYGGLGRPRKHGTRFAFKEPESWPEPDQWLRIEDEQFGQVEIQYWSNLHALEDADTPFAVVRIQTHLERDRLPEPIWLGWLGPAYEAERLWRFFLQRPTIEHSIRWRNQLLYWTLPEFHDNGPADNWSTLVTLAHWQLYLARPCVPDQPLPWQAPQQQLTPRRVQQSIWVLFLKIGTPAAPPKTRGKSPGWPKGKPRRRRQRHSVVKKGDP
jgi:hypothetical protein